MHLIQGNSPGFSRLLPFLILIGFILFCQAQSVRAAEERSNVVVVVADGISLSEINSDFLPSLTRLINEGGLGLLNTRTLGAGSESGYLTLGVGDRAKAPRDYKPDNPAGQAVSLSEIDSATLGLSGVVHLFASEIADLNLQGERGAVVGSLGQVLTEADHKVGVLGNADTSERRHREIVMVAMDGSGRVEHGGVDSAFSVPSSRALGNRVADVALIASRSEALLNDVDLLVIESGDTSRVNFEVLSTHEGVGPQARDEAVQRLDELLGKLMGILDSDSDSLVLVAPSAPQDLPPSRSLTPIVGWGKGFESGILVTSTTRRPGIVTNMDFAPTILQLFEVEPPSRMAGRPISSEPFVDTVSYLASKQESIAATELARKPMLTAFVSVAVAMILTSLLFIIAKIREWPIRLARVFLLGVLSTPLAMLISAGWEFEQPGHIYLSTALITVLITLGALALRRFGGGMPIVGVGLATAIALIGDIIAGSPLSSNSVLGYSIIGGARFYGIGNEYMGVLLGSTIVGVGAIVDRFRPGKGLMTGIILGLGVILVVMAMPFWGANVGGTVAVAAGFSALVIRLFRSGFTWRDGLVLAVVVVAAVGVLLAVDITGDSPSHAGEALTGIVADGGDNLFKILERKVLLNYKLLKVTIWSQILLAGLVVMATLMFRPPGVLKEFQRDNPKTSGALIALLVGVAFAFAFNDSGVIAAATATIFGLGALLYLATTPLAQTGLRE